MTPISNPSGERKRLTLCPQGSVLFLTSIRYPADSNAAVAVSRFSTSEFQPCLRNLNVRGPDIFAETRLCRLREWPQSERLGAGKILGMKIAAAGLLKFDAEHIVKECAALLLFPHDWAEARDEKNF